MRYASHVSWWVEYFEDETGHESVQGEIGGFPKKAQAKILRFIDLLQAEGPINLGAGYVRHIEDDIWELRVDSGHDRYRVLYFIITDRTIVLLRAFLKKTQRTPRGEIRTAQRRMEKVKEAHERGEGR